MLIDQVFFYFLIAAGVLVSLPALWLVMRARWPQRVEKLREVSARSMLVSFLMGLPVLGIILGSLPLIAFLGRRMDLVKLFGVVLLVAMMAVATLAGLAGLVTLIGERLMPSTGNAEPWKATLRGGVIMVCLLSMPYVGWFVLLPVCIVTGGGMMVRSFFIRSGQPAPSYVPALAPTPPPMTAQAQSPIL